jgi:hypothetical protein
MMMLLQKYFMLSLHVDWNQTWLWGFASVISWSGECCFHIGICNHEKSHAVSTTWIWSRLPCGKSVIGCQCSRCDVTKALMLPPLQVNCYKISATSAENTVGKKVCYHTISLCALSSLPGIPSSQNSNK